MDSTLQSGHPAHNHFDLYQNCHLCPRRCGVDRTTGQRGFCGETAECRVAAHCPHFGEEPSFSGTRGSGTLFFSGCSCRCFFCQNYQISLQPTGTPTTRDELVAMCMELVAKGVHNLNFVTPDHFWPHIHYACNAVRAAGVDVPFIYNCSGYQAPGLLDDIAATIDIFLPDFKYSDPALARRCMQADDYPEVALKALSKMVELKGFLEPFDSTGKRTAQRGVLVRHLVLPGEIDNSIALLRLLRREFGRMLPLSIMSQFRPMPECHTRHQLDRLLTAAEYRRVCDELEVLGFQQVYLQPALHDSGFVPDFTDGEPFAGNRAPDVHSPNEDF